MASVEYCIGKDLSEKKEEGEIFAAIFLFQKIKTKKINAYVQVKDTCH